VLDVDDQPDAGSIDFKEKNPESLLVNAIFAKDGGFDD
jgi:hypothetical protein